METLMHPSATYPPAKLIFGNGSFGFKNTSFVLPGGFTFSPQNLSLGLRTSVIVAVKKNKKKKEDTHSFIPKPDEATGPFPEAVLLKEKKVQEDGKLLPEFVDDEEQKLYEYLSLELESQQKVERMRHYEVVYLIHEKHAEEVGSVNEKVQDFLREKKGRIWRLNDWGMRRLAYKIQKAKNAHYILMNFELEAQWINDFKSMLDNDERVIRHLVIKRDEAITEDCPPPPEFHTLRASMDDDDEEDDLDYDDETYDEDWDGEGELEDYDNEMEDGIIVVDSNEDDDTADTNNTSTNISNTRRRKQVVGRVR